MITLVNEDLFTFVPCEDVDRNGNPYFRLRILSSNKLVRTKPEDDNNVIQYDPKQSYKGKPHNAAHFEPIVRDIVNVAAPDENYNNYASILKVSESDRSTYVRVDGSPDKTRKSCNLFLLAIPFNGMLNPIPPSRDYRIYKGLIVTSSRAFWFNNNRFRKVLYLVVEPNVALFTNTNGAQCSKINISIEAFGLIKAPENPNMQHTNHDTSLISIEYQPDAEDPDKYPYVASYSFTREELDHPVYMEKDAKAELWSQFHFTSQQQSRKPRFRGDFQQTTTGASPSTPYNKPRYNNNQGSYQKDSRPRYDNERRSSYQQPKPVDKERDLDMMIESSGLRETGKRLRDDYYNGGYKKPHGNKGKKSKRRNQGR